MSQPKGARLPAASPSIRLMLRKTLQSGNLCQLFRAETLRQAIRWDWGVCGTSLSRWLGEDSQNPCPLRNPIAANELRQHSKLDPAEYRYRFSWRLVEFAVESNDAAIIAFLTTGLSTRSCRGRMSGRPWAAFWSEVWLPTRTRSGRPASDITVASLLATCTRVGRGLRVGLPTVAAASSAVANSPRSS